MEQYLVLFSGGMDSFLTAAMYAEQNIPTILITMNNGAIAGEEYILHGVKRLQNRYGKNLITYAGACSTNAVFQRLRYGYYQTPCKDIAEQYPNLQANQLQCLHCQSAMWVSAIAYAVAKNIKHIAAGYHSYDEFCTGYHGWVKEIKTIAKEYKIETEFPVWDENDWQDKYTRQMAMIDRSFEPQVLEPKCMLGMPSKRPNEPEYKQLVQYFIENIAQKMPEMIDNLVPHYRVAKLFNTALRTLDYPMPEPNGRIY